MPAMSFPPMVPLEAVDTAFPLLLACMTESVYPVFGVTENAMSFPEWTSVKSTFRGSLIVKITLPLLTSAKNPERTMSPHFSASYPPSRKYAFALPRLIASVSRWGEP